MRIVFVKLMMLQRDSFLGNFDTIVTAIRNSSNIHGAISANYFVKKNNKYYFNNTLLRDKL